MMKIPKILDSCAILSIFNIKNWNEPPKIVDSCTILLGIFNIKKIREPSINVCLKIKIEQ